MHISAMKNQATFLLLTYVLTLKKLKHEILFPWE